MIELPLETSTFTLERTRAAVVVVVDLVPVVEVEPCAVVVVTPMPGVVTGILGIENPGGARVPTWSRTTPSATARITMAAARTATTLLMAPPPLPPGSPAPGAVPPSTDAACQR